VIRYPLHEYITGCDASNREHVQLEMHNISFSGYFFPMDMAVLATYDIQREKYKLPLQLSGHVTPESHRKSREGAYPCSCSQNLLCQKDPSALYVPWSAENDKHVQGDEHGEALCVGLWQSALWKHLCTSSILMVEPTQDRDGEDLAVLGI